MLNFIPHYFSMWQYKAFPQLDKLIFQNYHPSSLTFVLLVPANYSKWPQQLKHKESFFIFLIKIINISDLNIKYLKHEESIFYCINNSMYY